MFPNTKKTVFLHQSFIEHVHETHLVVENWSKQDFQIEKKNRWDKTKMNSETKPPTQYLVQGFLTFYNGAPADQKNVTKVSWN